MVAGLLHHSAQASNNVDSNLASFDRQLAALRGRYPRGPAHWKEVLDTALIGQEASTGWRQRAAEAENHRSSFEENYCQGKSSSKRCMPHQGKNAEVLLAIKDLPS